MGDTKQPHIRALQCAMCGCLKKATAMHPYAKPQSYGLVLACFSLSCNPGKYVYVALHFTGNLKNTSFCLPH